MELELHTHRFLVTHDPSGDEAEADTKDAAILAAKTLLQDNELEGTCRIWQGREVIDVVWAVGPDNPDSIIHTSLEGGR